MRRSPGRVASSLVCFWNYEVGYNCPGHGPGTRLMKAVYSRSVLRAHICSQMDKSGSSRNECPIDACVDPPVKTDKKPIHVSI